MASVVTAEAVKVLTVVVFAKAAEKVMLALEVAIVTVMYIMVLGVTLKSFLIVGLAFLHVVA